MQIKNNLLFIGLVIFIISSFCIGCANDLPKSSKQSVNPFIEQSWQLTAIHGTPIDSPYLKTPFIVFDTSGRILGSFSCNNFFGTYMILNKKKIDISYTGSTKMLCSEMALEKKFASALKSEISRYRMEDDTLVLFNKNGEVLRFKKE
ncbi:MAG: META domain-containing protein [Bacteroidales bacterium]|jgi:heat shock protein HslJ|nr:META domain-containing protein [Bacteroidales bacterium]